MALKDNLKEEITRIKRLMALLDEDPKMEDTIRKLAGEHMLNGSGSSTNGRTRARVIKPTEGAETGILAKAIEHVQHNGPSTRQEILAATGMPGGSFSHFVRKSGKFIQGVDGKWALNPKSKASE
jgi:hypothetical protein